MLRKTYRLMQKTTAVFEATQTHVMRMTSGTDKHGPDAFICCPPEVWAGNATQGQELLNFITHSTDDQLVGMMAPAGFQRLDTKFHAFGWLSDLRSIGTDDARFAAIRMITAWIQGNINDPSAPTWDMDLLAQRIVRMVGTYAFYMPALTPEQNTLFAAALSRQAMHLKRARAGDLRTPLSGIIQSCGLITAGIALSTDMAMTHQGVKALSAHIQKVILHDGVPATRKPDDLVLTLKMLIDIRGMIQGAGIPVPSPFAHAIDRIVPALRFFRMGDHAFPVMHGSSEGVAHMIEDVLQKSVVTARAPLSLPMTGFERLAAGNICAIIDVGTPTSVSPYLSTTAFEMSVGEHRLITGCGAHAYDKMWQDLLHATSAHSTLTIDHQDNKSPKSPMHVIATRNETDEATLVHIHHNGYLTRSGFIHDRRFFMAADGADLRGEDVLSADIPPVTPADYTIRFHLHPRVTIAPMGGGGGVLIKMPDGTGLRFVHDGDSLTVEDSVYLGATGLPQKTKQIVVSGKVYGAEKTIRWAFKLG